MNKRSLVVLCLILFLISLSLSGAQNETLNDTSNTTNISSEEIINEEPIKEEPEPVAEPLQQLEPPQHTDLSLDIKNSHGHEVTYTVDIKDQKGKSLGITNVPVARHHVRVDIKEEHPVKKIVFTDLKVDNKQLPLGLDIIPNNKVPEETFVQVYAINPVGLDFSTALVTATAKGTTLYKCRDWDFNDQTCEGSWEFFKSITPGEEYTFTLTPNDPGYAEGIEATDAVHLDENYGFIADIFEQVKAFDGLWSEPIYQDEYVRVTFERPLFNGNMIDVIVRSNGTIAYFNIYKAGTDQLVGRSSVIDNKELVYTMVEGLSQPTDTFDFKVIKVFEEYDEADTCYYACIQDCTNETGSTCEPDCHDDCHSFSTDPSIRSFLEFDYIHDDVINSTQADGLLGYEERNIQTPRYRNWNESNVLSAELSASDVGGDITWIVVKGSPTRDEIIMGIEDKTNDVNIQVFNSSDSWGNLLEVSTDVPNSGYRAFDIAYEELVGDALIVYENSSSNTNNGIAYRTWNGTAYTSERGLDTTLTNDEVRWIQLTPDLGSDAIMLLVHNSLGDLYAVQWNGTDFETNKELALSTGTTSSTEQHFAFAWEDTSGEGLVGYGEGNDLVYRSYDPDDPLENYWGSEATIGFGNGLDALRMCSAPNQNYIGIILQDGGNDVNVRMWDGSAILGSPPTEEATTEPNGASNANVDCAWDNPGNTALFGYIDLNADALVMSYFNFTRATNTWGVSDLDSAPTTATFGTDDIQGLRFSEHPTTNETMIVAQGIAEDVTLIRWNGTDFLTITSSPVETLTEVTNGAQESAMFDWYRYDSPPTIFNITPDSTNFNKNSIIRVSANVTDNINVSAVLGNITLPNGTIVQTTLLDSDNNEEYNSTFSNSDKAGYYILRIIANDTSNKVNSTENRTFTVGDVTYPNLTIVTPTAGQNFDLNTHVNITVNVTDNIQVGMVVANITFPNGTIFQLQNFTNTTSTLTFPSTFEGNYTDTGTKGSYVLRIIANDTENNVNITQTVNFSMGDNVNPTVTTLTPTADTNFAASGSVNITAKVTDDVNVSAVIANVTLPNGTVDQAEMFDDESNTVYNVTFTNTILNGTYDVRIVANDTSDNLNTTETTNFTVADSTPPSIQLNAPIDFFNASFTSIAFNFTGTDESSSTLNCSFILDGIINTTNESVSSGVQASFTITTLSESHHYWSVNCTDSANNLNNSETRNFTADVTPPTFVSLVTTPSSEADLDPDLLINVTANVTDNLTGVHTVILQYQNLTDSSFTNITMVLNESNNVYNASFTVFGPTNYTLRVVANDTAGNLDFSNNVIINVSNESTWELTPASFTVIGKLNETTLIGNLLYNNTGDESLVFNTTSTSSNTNYNETENFTLSAKETKTLSINDTGTQAGTNSFTYAVAATLGEPNSRTTNVNVVVADGQPVLVATFTTPSGESTTVTKGDVNVEFDAQIENIGEGNASNITFTFHIPSDWTTTLNEINTTFDEILSGENDTHNIEVTINSDATTGLQIITANVTEAVNASDVDLNSLGLVFADTVNVTVNGQAQLGSGSSGGASGGGGSSSGGSSSGGSGGGGGSGVSKVGDGETMHTTETIALKRGQTQTVPITVTNFYENAVLENIEIEIQGFMSQYVQVEAVQKQQEVVYKETRTVELIEVDAPVMFKLSQMREHSITLKEIRGQSVDIVLSSDPIDITLEKDTPVEVDVNDDNTNDFELVLDKVNDTFAQVKVHKLGLSEPHKLYYLEDQEYLLTISAPSYLERDDYDLTMVINAKMVAVNSQLAGFIWKPLTEFRKLLFKVLDVDVNEAERRLEEARKDVDMMIAAGFPTTRMKELLTAAESAFVTEEFWVVVKKADDISILRKSAFSADDLIKEVQEGIEKAKKKWLKVPESETALVLAMKAFEREDFESALERAKDAQLTYILETKGRVNILWFFTYYWWAVILGSFALFFTGFFTYKKLVIAIITQRLKNVGEEEIALNELIKEAQQEHFSTGKMSSSEFNKVMVQYESRLDKIQRIRVKLRNKKVSILKTEQQIKSLEKEERGLFGLMKKAQYDYLRGGTLSRNKFMRTYSSEKGQLADVEEEKALLQEKLDKQKFGKKQKFLHWLNSFIVWIEQYFERRRERRLLGKEKIWPPMRTETEQVQQREQKKPVWKPRDDIWNGKEKKEFRRFDLGRKKKERSSWNIAAKKVPRDDGRSLAATKSSMLQGLKDAYGFDEKEQIKVVSDMQQLHDANKKEKERQRNFQDMHREIKQVARPPINLPRPDKEVLRKMFTESAVTNRQSQLGLDKPKKPSVLSQDAQSKAKRREVYKRLRDDLGIDIDDD